MGETIVVPPMVSEDAPSEPHAGEPPSPNQLQPVYPDLTGLHNYKKVIAEAKSSKTRCREEWETS